MAKLNIAPTKSSYLVLKRQLAFAEEGYELLEQKRQILIFELMSRLGRARDMERRASGLLAEAYAALREATLTVGSEALDAAALGVKLDHNVHVLDQAIMGIRVPKVTVKPEPPTVQFGFGGTSVHADLVMKRFVEALVLLGELAELENAILRLARELRKTQRRCNALSKTFIPDYRQTIAYIVASLEERERESFIILKMIKDRLARTARLPDGQVEGSVGHA
jgi:V/A-type H+-transporting ATPase subunit D